MRDIKELLIREDNTIKEALKQIDFGGKKIVFVVDCNNRLIGSVSDGDIRRAILNNISLDNHVEQIINKNPKSVFEADPILTVKSLMLKHRIEVIPQLNIKYEIVDILFWDQIFGPVHERIHQQIDLPVVIMAGGKGTRMDPFTRILPKPLIPIGDKPIIEVIMDEYAKFGMKNFFISINHKGKMIKTYFEDHESGYSIVYINEEKPLGTAGALKYLIGKIDSSFFVSNCDIIIKDDYSKIYEFHKEEKYALTMVASMQHHTIPYGVCEIENGGELKNMIEKPQYDFLVNSGMYLLNPEVLRFIPENEFFHFTHLIDRLKKNGYKIGVYPVSEKSYIDVGQWGEYKKAIEQFKL